MRILVIGQGGREHALVWKLKQDPRIKEIFVAPGNGGTAGIATNVPVEVDDIKGLVNLCIQEGINLVVPAPELPLTLGIVDACRDAGIACFGPDAYAAKLEGSKSFAKDVMYAAGVPTAEFGAFDNYDDAVAYVKAKGAPIVIKADGLAAGKGVVVAMNMTEALGALEEIMVGNIFKDSGSKVVIEEMMEGEEVSCLAFCDGERALLLPSAQDHKRVYDDDKGPNTGGMGAYSPMPLVLENRHQEILDLIFKPVLEHLKKEGHPFKGILYAGLMLTKSGIKVVEFNVRFGDPECQPLLMRLEDNLLDLMSSCIKGALYKDKINVSDDVSVGIVIAAEGYPGSYKKGMEIKGITEAEKLADNKLKVFHSGTKLENGVLSSTGGRVLCVTALAPSLDEAIKLGYQGVSCIDMPYSQYRTDIGAKGIKNQK
ncbi:phosphoribosylamine--glycine ligase [Desulfovibrio litoralis]|uniref:Phosphoribosylamine--glycine ligase n=1 Tax=Desulfovibrio litoralis DSM 11393 TaxID=1121455 RepID=A0A1M7SPV9_9BACT|nr:phosphoribosylamine--glycine ligase [Desulfovibrio litoralis]SHN60450.1 phosphoribosylamine--glycine ligase [Desulfovibrio litoralis DSM 11393]